MIRILGLLSMFLLSLWPNSAIVFMPGQAWAACCGSTCKPLMCTCRGTYPCAYEPDDNWTGQPAMKTNAGPSQINTDRKDLASAVTILDLTDSFSELTTASKCFRDKLALGLLGNAQAGLKSMTFLTNADK